MIRTYRAFAEFGRPYRRALRLGALLAMLQVIVSLAEPWPLRVVVDQVLNDSATGSVSERRSLLAMAVVALVVIVGIAGLLDYWSSRLLAASGLHIANDVRAAVYAHLQRLSLTFHGRQQVGDISSRVTGDVDKAQEMLTQTLGVIGPNVMLMVGMFTVMFTIDALFALLALALALHRAGGAPFHRQAANHQPTSSSCRRPSCGSRNGNPRRDGVGPSFLVGVRSAGAV